MLNKMCYECSRLNKDCKGSDCQVWTNCIYKVIDKNKSKLLTLLTRFEVLEKRANKAEALYEADPENPRKEEFFDFCYKQEFDAYILLANSIVDFTSGKINFDTAKKMIQEKRSELFAILLK